MRSGGHTVVDYPPLGKLSVHFEFDHGYYPYLVLSYDEEIKWYFPERDPNDHLGRLAGLCESNHIDDCNNDQSDFYNDY